MKLFDGTKQLDVIRIHLPQAPPWPQPRIRRSETRCSSFYTTSFDQVALFRFFQSTTNPFDSAGEFDRL